MSLAIGPDGLARCPWGNDPAMVDYHDNEWGHEIRDERGLFERLSLESFQSGLSWAIILRKRPGFRAAFADFDPSVVADFGPSDVERLMADASIVRNRAKIEAAIKNARAVLDLDGEFVDVVWSFAPVEHVVPVDIGDVPATTDASVALSKELKRRGFGFFGPTTAYAMMQAIGMVNDHLQGCIARDR